MEINTTNRTVSFDPNLLAAANAGTDGSNVELASKKSANQPVLLGANILVSYGITDIEALVSQLKNENADTRLSMKLKSLSSIAEGLSTQHLVALEKALALADSVKQLESAQNDLAGDTQKSKAELAILQLQTESLEKQIENARQNAEEYNKNMEKLQAKKAEIDKKLSELEEQGEKADQAQIAELKTQLSDIETQIKANADAKAATEAKLQADTASLEGAKDKANALQSTIDKNTAEIERNKNEISSLNAQISSVVSSLDENMLKSIAVELAVVDPEKAESPHDIAKKDAKLEATDVVKLISDALDAIAKDILEEVAEKRIETV